MNSCVTDPGIALWEAHSGRIGRAEHDWRPQTCAVLRFLTRIHFVSMAEKCMLLPGRNARRFRPCAGGPKKKCPESPLKGGQKWQKLSLISSRRRSQRPA